MKKLLFILCFFATLPLFGQTKKYSWDFFDCEIRDILYAVSLDTGISIVADDTVKGKGSFRFVGDDFETGFNSFLSSCRLYVKKIDDVWTVSKFKIEKTDNAFYLDAYDLLPLQVIEKLSLFVSQPITYESLPTNLLNLHFSAATEFELLQSLCMYFTGYEVLKNERGYHFAKNQKMQKHELSLADIVFNFEADGKFFVDVKNAIFTEVLNKFFDFICAEEKKSFCIMANTDVKILRTSFVAKDYLEALNKLCTQNGFESVFVDGIFYIVSNSGAKELLISEPKTWKKYKLNYLKAEKFVPFVNKKVGKIDQIVLPDEYSVLLKVSNGEDLQITELLNYVDVKTQTYLLTLEYITPQDLLKFLPPSVDKNSITVADDNSCIYFKGTEEAYKNVCKEISLCDRPAQRISYDLLILQYDENSENMWSSNFAVNRLSKGNQNNGSVQLGSVMNLNLNVISAFGLNFAANLQSSIEENETRVFADTTLHGISGKKINFQNTNTYRYRDNNVDPETGKPIYSGVTREIISGIKIDILGRVSGNGMITSTVTASVTRQGVDTSSSTGNPPPTTEKIVTTEVCGKSGEVVVLSGLIQNAQTETEKRTPIFSKIPILGNLFKNKNKINQNSQMVIYLVPYLENLENKVEENIETWVINRGNKFLNSL